MIVRSDKSISEICILHFNIQIEHRDIRFFQFLKRRSYLFPVHRADEHGIHFRLDHLANLSNLSRGISGRILYQNPVALFLQ